MKSLCWHAMMVLMATDIFWSVKPSAGKSSNQSFEQWILWQKFVYPHILPLTSPSTMLHPLRCYKYHYILLLILSQLHDLKSVSHHLCSRFQVPAINIFISTSCIQSHPWFLQTEGEGQTHKTVYRSKFALKMLFSILFPFYFISKD